MLLRQLSYALKTQLKAPKPSNRDLSCLSPCLYGLRVVSIPIIDAGVWRKQDNDSTLNRFFLCLPTYHRVFIFRAAGPGHVGVVRLLLAVDRLVVDIPDRYGNTALHTACEEERPEICQLLISHGANRDLANKEEKTPLQLCSPQFARSLKS